MAENGGEKVKKELTEQEKRLLELASGLSEISYYDWFKLKILVDRLFDREKRKMETELHLPMVSADDLLLI